MLALIIGVACFGLFIAVYVVYLALEVHKVWFRPKDYEHWLLNMSRQKRPFQLFGVGRRSYRIYVTFMLFVCTVFLIGAVALIIVLLGMQ